MQCHYEIRKRILNKDAMQGHYEIRKRILNKDAMQGHYEIRKLVLMNYGNAILVTKNKY